MPRVRCRYVECVYIESGICGADQIDLDPELGCLTYTQEEEDLSLEADKEEWDEEELIEEEEWDEEELEEDLDEDFEDEDDEW